MDLSKIEGLTEDQQAAISAMVEQETSGLKKKADELLSEKKTVQQLAHDKDATIEEARQAAIKAEEEKLIAEGNYKEALELREKEKAELIAKAENETKAAREALDKYHKGNALNGALNLIHDDYKDLAKAQLSNMLKISYNDQGEAVTTFEQDGQVVANNVDEFKGWAGEQAAFKKILNGVDSSGAGTERSRASGSQSDKPYSEMSLQEQVAHNKNVTPQRN